jgi:hypothetical protein
LFRSGNSDHPTDKFFNTTVEVLPTDHLSKQDGPLDNTERINAFPRTHDGFLIVGQFNHETGVAEGQLDTSLGDIHSMRLHVQAPSEAWVILSEVSSQVPFIQMPRVINQLYEITDKFSAFYCIAISACTFFLSFQIYLKAAASS